MACIGGLVIPHSWHFGHPGSVTRVNDEDLRVVRRVVPEDQNGFFILARERPVYWPRDTQASDEAHRLISGRSSDLELAE